MSVDGMNTDGANIDGASTDGDREWSDLAQAWQADDSSAEMRRDIPADIRRKVQRFSWGLIALTVAEIGFLSLALAFLTWRAWQTPKPLEITTAVAIWIFAIVGMGFTLWNRRGTWRPAAETTQAFLELSHRRCVRKLIGIRYAWRTLAVELALFIPWIVWVVESNPEKKARAPGVYVESYGYLATFVFIAAIILLEISRRTRRERQEMTAMLEDVDSGNSAP